ncbi:uncharacterized protein SOCE836_088970 [Sorangium cellulosum]|uniref:Uncharacterized protein n=1 Tax=Sorangium cellulosum TaxID=56 RepID=A0A4P2R187_SORCE|nr:hypothetical protein [Sorangium cellulosum]AUX36689.1 uncharacterized protein SOCE836_088970 [Sorangium cellulosum]
MASVVLAVLVALAGAYLLRSAPANRAPHGRGGFIVPRAGSIGAPLLRAAHAASKAPRGRAAPGAGTAP